MGAWSYEELRQHVGHTLVCVDYGYVSDPVNVAVECLSCNMVLFDYDRPASDLSDEEEDAQPERSRETVTEPRKEPSCEDINEAHHW